MSDIRVHPPLLYVAGTLWPPVCAGIVVARFATRRAMRGTLGVDDWLTIPALGLIFGMAAAILAGTAQGALGRPTPEPDPGTIRSDEQMITGKIYSTITILTTVALTFIKLSCMFFYRRIFGNGSGRTIKIVINVINVLIIIWGISFAFGYLFFCGAHLKYHWMPFDDSVKCGADVFMIDEAMSISDVIMDFIIMIFPIPLILRLSLSWTKKLMVMGIFLLGAVAIAASITRLAIIVDLLDAWKASQADPDFVSTAGLYFMYLEACFSLVAVCLPSLSGVLRLQPVQSLIDGFSETFSRISRSSSLKSSRSSATSGQSKERVYDDVYRG